MFEILTIQNQVLCLDIIFLFQNTRHCTVYSGNTEQWEQSQFSPYGISLFLILEKYTIHTPSPSAFCGSFFFPLSQKGYLIGLSGCWGFLSNIVGSHTWVGSCSEMKLNLLFVCYGLQIPASVASWVCVEVVLCFESQSFWILVLIYKTLCF